MYFATVAYRICLNLDLHKELVHVVRLMAKSLANIGLFEVRRDVQGAPYRRCCCSWAPSPLFVSMQPIQPDAFIARKKNRWCALSPAPSTPPQPAQFVIELVRKYVPDEVDAYVAHIRNLDAVMKARGCDLKRENTRGRGAFRVLSAWWCVCTSAFLILLLLCHSNRFNSLAHDS